MKVTVIGTGFGKHLAAPAYQAAGFDVEVISPRDDAAVQAALRSDVDLVSVHSPPFLHVEHVLGAIDNGRAVLCDKPFGRNAEEARIMRDRAHAAGVRHFLNFEFRHRQSWAKLKELVDAGTIGEPTHLSWAFIINGLRGRDHGWLNDAELGGGWIGALGSHLIDFTRWLFSSEIVDCGGVTRIDGSSAQATAEDAYFAWFQLENGGTATHDTAGAAAVRMDPRAVLLGDSGSIELISETTLVVRRTGSDTETVQLDKSSQSSTPALTEFFGRVAESLRTDTQITPSFDDGLAVAQAMERLRRNAIRVPGRQP